MPFKHRNKVLFEIARTPNGVRRALGYRGVDAWNWEERWGRFV